MKNLLNKKLNADEMPQRVKLYNRMFADIPTIKGYEKMEALPQMKYREKMDFGVPLAKDVNPNKCFFESKYKKHTHASKQVQKQSEKDVLLDWYSNPREIKKNVEASKQLMEK